MSDKIYFNLGIIAAITTKAGQQLNYFILCLEKNLPPVAVAGPNLTLSVPVDIVTLDGSGSSDDEGIESYTWTVVRYCTTKIE